MAGSKRYPDLNIGNILQGPCPTCGRLTLGRYELGLSNVYMTCTHCGAAYRIKRAALSQTDRLWLALAEAAGEVEVLYDRARHAHLVEKDRAYH